ncbi:MAG: hypothetical protein NZ654_06520 [Acidimicrobiales bacterium]|nr:hypothetical protein [Acidimicrobiales bacterium]
MVCVNHRFCVEFQDQAGDAHEKGHCSMAIEVETKDCTMLGDAEIEEMADLCAEGPNPFGIGLISKQVEEWVLCSTGRENGRLKGFSFCTLERIGGTPSVILGLGSIHRTSKRDTVLRALMSEQLRRAVLAFPDEDVVVGVRFNEPSGFEAYRPLSRVVPRPGYKASGEDRAWGRRFVKRFGMSTASYDEHTFRAQGSDGQACVLDHTSLKAGQISTDEKAIFAPLDLNRGDVVVAVGWAMAEDLEKLL